MDESMPVFRGGCSDGKEEKFIGLSPPHIGSLEMGFVEEAFRSNWMAPAGPNIDGFEKEMASYLGVGGAVALSSGTAALHLGLIALGVGAGGVVLCSSHTFAASAQPILYLNAIPVLVDSEPETWNMSPLALRKALTKLKNDKKKVQAVVVANVYGLSADFDALRPICDEFNVPILEDAAESLGAEYKGKKSGTFGDVTALSFNGNKIITTTGGGMLVSNNLEWLKRVRFLSTQAKDPAPYYSHSEIGYNYRMSNVLAGIGRGQLALLDERVNRKREIYENYKKALPQLHFMPEQDGSKHSRWLTTCLLPEGEEPAEFVSQMLKRNIETRRAFNPMHRQKLFQNAKFYSHWNKEESKMPVADELFKRGLCLPSGTAMTDEEQNRVITALSEVLGDE